MTRHLSPWTGLPYIDSGYTPHRNHCDHCDRWIRDEGDRAEGYCPRCGHYCNEADLAEWRDQQ